MIRAPGNVSCGNDMSVVAPFVDEAIGAVSARYKDVVRVGPKLEAGDCAWFKNGGPHFTPDGAAAMAKRIAARYGVSISKHPGVGLP